MGIHLSDAKVPKGTRVYAIGDVHGCLDELDQLLDLIKDDLETTPTEKPVIVFLGDYVDRGPDSAGVIKRLMKLQKKQANVICLKGNHEDKFLDFLANPRPLASGFFAYGGMETSQSFGIKKRPLSDPLKNAAQIRDLLMDSISKKQLKFLRALQTSVSIGDYFFCHAGIKPDIKLNKQDEYDLLWIRQEFLSWPKLHKKIIVHGHTPQAEPEVLANRINVDTKCYATGVLSCVVLEEDKHRFLQTAISIR